MQNDMGTATERHYGSPPTEKMFREWRKQRKQLKLQSRDKKTLSLSEMARIRIANEKLGNKQSKYLNISFYENDNFESQVMGNC